MSKSGKGSGFERELSKQMSLWWSGGERDDLVWRTSQSGGRATQRAKQAIRTKYGYGDLTFTDPSIKPLFDLLVISAKRGYTNTSKPLSSSDSGKFASQCMTICDSKEIPIAKMIPEIKKGVSKLFSKTKKSGGVDLLDVIDKPSKKTTMIGSWIKDCYRDADLAQLPYWMLIFRRDGGKTCCCIPNNLHIELARCSNRTTLQNFGASFVSVYDESITTQYIIVSLEIFFHWCSPGAILNLSKSYKGSSRRVKPNE